MDLTEGAPVRPVKKEQAAPVRGAAILVCVVALSTGLWGVGLSALTVQSATSDDSVSGAAAAFRQFRCLERQIVSQTDKNSRVYVDIKDPFWHQRITEFSLPWRKVVYRERLATVVLTVSSEESNGDCDGITLKIVNK